LQLQLRSLLLPYLWHCELEIIILLCISWFQVCTSLERKQSAVGERWKEIQVRLTDLSVVVEIQSTTTRSTVDANLGFSLLLEGDRALLRNEKSVNYARAIECFQQALNVGNATAAVFLAIMHHNGIGCELVNKDKESPNWRQWELVR
jgi:hypothetical protein